MTIHITKRLVELTAGGYGTEIDLVKLKRVAKEFKAWLLTVDSNNDPFGFLRKDLPLVDSALNGTMELPFRGTRPHNWEIREGELDWYLAHSSEFYNTIRGSNLVVNEDKDGYTIGLTIIEKDGKRYAWAEFELPEDDAP
jgi:hypothetical protein